MDTTKGKVRQPSGFYAGIAEGGTPCSSVTYRDAEGVERYRYGLGGSILKPSIKEAEVGAFRDDVNMVVSGYMGRISYAEAIGVLFGVATDLAREAREEAEKKQ